MATKESKTMWIAMALLIIAVAWAYWHSKDEPWPIETEEPVLEHTE